MEKYTLSDIIMVAFFFMILDGGIYIVTQLIIRENLVDLFIWLGFFVSNMIKILVLKYLP